MSRLILLSQLSIKSIDLINETIGRWVAWLTFFMVLVTFSIVILRYAFDIGLIAMQELVTYMHALVFMLGAAYTLKHDAHVRVDIFYQRCSTRLRAWIDCFGTLLLLLPVAGYMLWSSWEYVMDSWNILESSRNSGGIPAVYLLKTTLLIMPILLLLQGISLFTSNLLTALGINTCSAEQD
jgi:TRAP-type mannitol/chloroaromatic compound transport system permease small subunit